nr:hypothetical protein [Klebsiella pneumoniae]
MIQDAFIRLRAKQLYWQGYPPPKFRDSWASTQNGLFVEKA